MAAALNSITSFSEWTGAFGPNLAKYCRQARLEFVQEDRLFGVSGFFDTRDLGWIDERRARVLEGIECATDDPHRPFRGQIQNTITGHARSARL